MLILSNWKISLKRKNSKIIKTNKIRLIRITKNRSLILFRSRLVKDNGNKLSKSQQFRRKNTKNMVKRSHITIT